jgi:hypothetical protein
LADRGIAHAFLVEDDLQGEKLARYDLILLPYLPLLSTEKQQALVRYVENGGLLLILGACGSKDQFNVPLANIPLAKMLGAARYPAQAVSRAVKKGQVQYLPLPIPASRFLIPMKSKGEYTTFGPTMADLFADIPEGYTRNRIDPALRKQLEQASDAALRLLKGKATRLSTLAPLVEITSMMAEDQSRQLLHLVNYDVTLDGNINPARNLSVEAALPAGRNAKTVRYCGDLTAMKNISFQPAGAGKISFVADQLEIYGLAVVELE